MIADKVAGEAGEYVLLRDGKQVLFRPYVPDDRSAVADFLQRLSDESRMRRFHSGGARVTAATVDQVIAGHALVAERGDRIVALASYYRLRDPERAEMAIAVDDAEQGKGIGTALFERLSQDALHEGVRRFLALVLAENHRMLGLLRNLGFRLTRTFDHGEVEVEVDLRQDDTYFVSADTRRHTAAVASLDPIFRPRSVAVVGASRQRGSIGHELFRNALFGGFHGVVYPVNPNARSILGVQAYPTVSAIPEPVDLAVIAVPAAAVLRVAEDCLDAGVRGLVVISAGFAEIGPDGRDRQEALARLCRSHSARLIGPNCLGILVNDPAGPLNATFAPYQPSPGKIAIASQSGALGIAILHHLQNMGLGVSAFVSMGNKADVSSNDLLEHWEEDPSTKAILLYLESFGNPRRFARVARRVGIRKPIIAVKGGRGEGGRRAAASHTAALAGSDVAVDALFRQAGVIRCDTLQELFDVAAFLATQPLPKGNRVAIITNAGGLGILCADACEANGMKLPTLSDATQTALRAILPTEASVANPIDMLASGSAQSYGDVLRHVIADPSVDAVIVLFIPPLVTDAADVAASLVAACNPPPAKPVLTCFVGAKGVSDLLKGAVAIPSYSFPEDAARALGHAVQRAEWLRRPVGSPITFTDVDRCRARAIAVDALAQADSVWLAPDAVEGLLHAYRIPLTSGLTAHSPDEAAKAFRRLRGPVAIKLVSRTIQHKSDVGGVRLGIDSPGAAADAYRAISASLAERGMAEAMDGALVQPMVTGGTECLVGVVSDPTFGPLIGFGLGGIAAEAVADVAFRLHPLTDVDADALIAGSRATRLLAGFRGNPPGDLAALRELLLRLSQLVDEVPEIAELDLNPVVVRGTSQSVAVLDARVRLVRPTH